MVKFLIFLLPLAWAASPSPRDPLHASCSVTGTLTTPIHRYVDDLTFTFVEGSDPTCLVDAYSVSETLSLLDYGTNYCNLFNLMDGSGLVNDPAFTEDTNNFI